MGLAHVTLFILACGSMVASYIGLQSTLPGETLYWKLFAAMISACVGAAIFTFWSEAFKAVLSPKRALFRAMSWCASLIGIGFILGLSSWWNVSAIGGAEAERAALAAVLTQGRVAVSEATGVSNALGPFESRIRSVGEEVNGLSRCEASNGCISGTAGAGGVSATLAQLGTKATGIADEIRSARLVQDQITTQGQACLSEISAILDGDDLATIRTELSPHVNCVNEAVTALSGTGQLMLVTQEMRDFTQGLVLPNSISSEAQMQAVQTALSSLSTRASGIGEDARDAIQSVEIAPITIPRQSAMLAVVVHYKAIIPAWITGLSLDLLPLILLVFAANVKADKRARKNADQHLYSVGDLISALDLAGKVNLAVNPPPVQTPANDVQLSPHKIHYQLDESEPQYEEENVTVVALTPKGSKAAAS